MQTNQLVSPGEYLASAYEPDAELVDGAIEERPVAQRDHAKWQLAILKWSALLEDDWNIRVYPSLRIRTDATNYRVADVLVLDAAASDEQIVAHPPLAVFEILSPEDRVQRVMRKLVDYEAMGVPGIYLVDPQTGAFQRSRAGDLVIVQECSVGQRTFPVAEIARLVR